MKRNHKPSQNALHQTGLKAFRVQGLVGLEQYAQWPRYFTEGMWIVRGLGVRPKLARC